MGPRRIFETRILCLRPDLYSKIYRNSVSHKAIILHLINNLISALTARVADRAAGRAEAFLAGQTPCHALLWRRHWTQLRKNKRKRPDKTSGRKRPRLDDVDVIPAGDIDQDELQDMLDEVIQTSTPEPETQQDPESAAEEDLNREICHKCHKVAPPETKTRNINWIGCDRCPRWFHKFCVGLRANKKLTHYIM